MFKRFVRILLLLSLLAPTVRPVAAVSPPRFPLADLGVKDISVRSIFDQVAVRFPLAEGRQITAASLDLHLSHGKKLLPERSELTIALNNEPVANLPFTAENADAGFIRIPIPIEALRPGENVLLFRFNLRLKDKGCSDEGNPSLWAKVHKDTVIEIQSVDASIQPNLGRYPAPFSTLSTLPGNPQLTIVLPENPTPAELTAAAQISAALGQAAMWKTPPVQAITFDKLDASRSASEHWIVISTADRNPLAADAEPGLSEQASPANPTRLMLVVKGSNETELLQSADMLSTRSARASLVGRAVAPISVRPLPPSERAAEVTFAGLGYDDRRVRGIGFHDLYYAIDVPYDWKITSDATIDIWFTHAPGLTSKTSSLMSAFINGFKVSDVFLTGRNETDGRLTIQLSPRQLHPGRNWLHLAFDLHLRREDCAFRYLKEAWAEVSASSSVVNLAHVRSKPPLDLRYLPSPLVTPVDLSDDLFVLPANPSPAELTMMVQMAAKLGTYSNADGLRPHATTAAFYSPQDGAARNVIAIGNPASHALLREFDSQFPQPLTPANGVLVPSGGREPLPAELTGQAGYIEMLPAPWGGGETLLVISAPDDIYPSLIDRLPTLGKRVKAEGNLGVVVAGKITGIEVGFLADTTLTTPARGVLFGVFFGAVIIMGGIGFAFTRRKPTHEETGDEEE